MMRISSVTMFDKSVGAINRQQAEFLRVGQQIASGRKITNPSDNPQVASQEVGLNQSKAVNEQYAKGRVSARNALAQQESILSSVTDALQRTRTLLVQASSDVLSEADRKAVASELEGTLEMILGQANATDGNGRYLFSGHRDSTTPFVRDTNGDIVYQGDANAREQLIDSSRQIPVNDSGDEVFRSIPQSRALGAEADPDNAGTVLISRPQVIDVADPDFGSGFTIAFDLDDGEPVYRINDGEPQPYSPGEAVVHAGVSIRLEGQPEAGDSVRVGAASELNTDMFASLQKAIRALEAPIESDSDRVAMKNTLNSVFREIDNSFDNILTRRASVGARLNEVDLLDSVGDVRRLNYEQALSDLVDLDYAEAVAEYSLRQVGLQAAQRAFTDIQGLSLFNYL